MMKGTRQPNPIRSKISYKAPQFTASLNAPTCQSLTFKPTSFLPLSTPPPHPPPSPDSILQPSATPSQQPPATSSPSPSFPSLPSLSLVFSIVPILALVIRSGLLVPIMRVGGIGASGEGRGIGISSEIRGGVGSLLLVSLTSFFCHVKRIVCKSQDDDSPGTISRYHNA